MIPALRDTLPSRTVRQAGLGNSGYDVHNGVYQVRIYGDAGKGPGEVEAKADAVADHFARGTDLTYNGVDVRLGNVSRNAGIIEDDRYVVAVSINYRVHAVPPRPGPYQHHHRSAPDKHRYARHSRYCQDLLVALVRAGCPAAKTKCLESAYKPDSARLSAQIRPAY